MFFRYLKLIFLLLVAVFFIAFAITNREAVAINLFPFPYSAELPKFLLAIACFTMGALAGGMVLSLRLAKYRHMYAKEHKRAMALENELKGLQLDHHQALPIAIDAK